MFLLLLFSLDKQLMNSKIIYHLHEGFCLANIGTPDMYFGHQLFPKLHLIAPDAYFSLIIFTHTYFF